jgi:Protein of unknown function (DUF2924)
MSVEPPEQINDVLAILKSAPIADLRSEWRAIFRTEPPSAFGPDLLRRSLAQHRQERGFGGLSGRARRELERAIYTLKHKKSGRIEVARRIKIGAVLVRQWKGQTFRVTVADRGFVFNGETFASLSEIARKITGTRWNGPRFFGLRASSHLAEKQES